jgi:hypothetical protein
MFDPGKGPWNQQEADRLVASALAVWDQETRLFPLADALDAAWVRRDLAALRLAVGCLVAQAEAIRREAKQKAQKELAEDPWPHAAPEPAILRAFQKERDRPRPPETTAPPPLPPAVKQGNQYPRLFS